MIELESEFLDLKQGRKTVEEYELMFDRLSRFAPSLVADQGCKMRRIEEGLKTHIRRSLAVVQLASFENLEDRAKNLETICKDTQDQKETNPKKKRKTYENRQRHSMGNKGHQH